MGIAAGTAKHAADLFKQASGVINRIPPDYKANYNTKVEQSTKLAASSEDKAKNVCFETVVSYEKIEIPDSKNYVKFDNSAAEPLAIVPHMNEVLRHVIPPEVRQMQSELKTQLQNQIDQQYKNLEKADLEQRTFLGQY